MKLARKLGFWDVFCIASGAMISSGLFILPGIAFAKAGPAAVLAYALAAVMVIPTAMAKAELASAMPQSGGSYFFVERSLGALPGTLAGLASWFSISLKSAFALIGFGALGLIMFPSLPLWTLKAVAVGFCVVFAGMNIISVKVAGRFQIIMVAFLLAILCGFVVLGMPKVQHASLANFMGKGFGQVFATAGLVFISFGGLTKVAALAGEVRKPGRNLPAGMFAALIVVSLLYVSAVFITVGVVKADQLSGSLAPLSLAGGAILGPVGAMVLSVAAMLAFATTGNSGILTASRSPLAMSRDGLLPDVFRKLSGRFNTPYVSILLTAGFMILVIVALSVKDLVKVASTMQLTLFAMNNMAVLIMRGSKLQNYRPQYRLPLFPWLPIASIVMYGLLIVGMGTIPLVATGLFAVGGVLWYFVYVRPRTTRESAFVYMVRNLVSKKMYRSSLEDELREIALERDEVIHDRFDRLIQNCAILDLTRAMPAEEMFSQAAAALSPRLNVSQKRLTELLKAREAESSTVIHPGLAIPHIVVDGKGLFDVLLVRCRDGMTFPGQDEPVRVAFLLAGSTDERNYHLRALMAIAHIVEEHDFTRRWLAAPKAEHLRDLVLLSERSRDV